MFCTHCGAEINDEAFICVKCGCKVMRKRLSHKSKPKVTIR